jgi:hypothetical protein
MGTRFDQEFDVSCIVFVLPDDKKAGGIITCRHDTSKTIFV